MGSILVIRPDDTILHKPSLVNEYRERMIEYFNADDIRLSLCKTLTYRDVQSYGKEAYEIVLALLRQFDQHDDLYVLVCLTKEWRDNGVVEMLRERCPRVVAVKAVWVGE